MTTVEAVRSTMFQNGNKRPYSRVTRRSERGRKRRNKKRRTKRKRKKIKMRKRNNNTNEEKAEAETQSGGWQARD
jgi:hypothetical protein